MGGLPPATYTYTYNVVINGGVVVMPFSFNLVLTDPCLNPVLSKPTLNTKEYTITEPGDSETFDPKFTVTPTFCSTSMHFTALGLAGFIGFDHIAQTVTYTQITDSLVLSGKFEGLMQKTWPVTIEYTAFDFTGVVPTSVTVTYDVIIKNPCIN